MNTNITGFESRAAHLAVVTNDPSKDLSAALAQQVAPSSGTSYGAAVAATGGISPQRRTAVELVAARYDKFEDALFSMVVATGVDPAAAPHIENAILSNTALREQAVKAFETAKRRSVMESV